MLNRLNELKTTLKAQLNRNDVVANNLANANTAGFKRDVMFSKVLKTKEGTQLRNEMGTDFSQGAVTQTNNSLDLAISGSAFFSVETEDGTAYTRDGHFTRSSDGYLTTTSGKKVLGEGGWIELSTRQNPSGRISVRENGDVFVDDEYIDRLALVQFEDTNKLSKLGENLFSAPDKAAEKAANYQVLQGHVESSNVQAVNEMISLIELQRQFESTQKAMKTLDAALAKAANNISRYR